MRSFIGVAFARRWAGLTLLGLCLFGALFVLRVTLQDRSASLDIVARLALLELPHVVALSTGLATYWTMDHLRLTGQLRLLACSGVDGCSFRLALLLPTVVLSFCMLVFNTTAFRWASVETRLG